MALDYNSFPMVSVITPAFNAGHFIEETIQSVLKQSYSNWEMIVVDDCSNDNTVDIVERYVLSSNGKVRLIKLNENKGCAHARNYAIKNANGEYIAFLDSDDLWHNDKLSIQIDFMLKNGIYISITSYEKFNESKKSVKIIEAIEKLDYNRMLFGNPIGCLTLIYNKLEFIDFCFETVFKISEDYAGWIDLSKKHPIFGIKQVLAFYRVHENGKSYNKFKPAKDTWEILYNKENLGFFRSLYCFSKYILNYIKKENILKI